MPTTPVTVGTRHMQGKDDPKDERRRQLGAQTLCKVSEELARDSSPEGVERALVQNQTKVADVDRVVERFARVTLLLRGKGLESCRIEKTSKM